MQNYPVGKELTLNMSITMTAADARQNFCIWIWFPKAATKTAANIDGTALSMPNGISLSYQLDLSISVSRGVGWYDSNFNGPQCRP